MDIDQGELDKLTGLERKATDYLNLNPIQRGGYLTEEAKEALVEWGDGYSICDYCKGTLEKIQKPPIDSFVKETLPKFLGADSARVTHGARESKYMIIHSLCEKGDTILVDGNAHYSTYLAAERHQVEVKEVEDTGYPEYKIEEEKYARRIEETNPSLALITYPDGNYGNLPDVEKIAKICREKDVPLVVNGAYAVGRMPVSLEEMGADFIIGSGHKSMAAAGPVGVLGTTEEYKDLLFRESEYKKGKEVELLGCGVRGVPIVTLMSSFPKIYERVKRWDQEVEKARYFINALEKIEGIRQLGEKPTNHDLNFLETDKFYEISQRHKKGRFFLYKELKKRGIIGVKPGLTKVFKVSTYGFKKDELKRIIDAFVEIADL